MSLKSSGEKVSAINVVVEDPAIRRDDLDVSRKVLRKLDFRLLPLVFLLYLLCYIDRANIGNAKVAGLANDLHLTGAQYNLCAAIFVIPYCIFEVPSNIALKRVGPSRWISAVMVVWGSIVISMGFLKNFGGLMTARVLLGATEAGMLPGLIYYLCSWYPRSAQARRIGVLYSGVTLSGAFGGLLAYAIEKMDGIGGLAGWSWIFILEGLLTVAVAAVFYLYMYDYPENATFLTDAERTWLLETIKRDNAGLSKQFKHRFIYQALRDPQAYILTAMYFTCAMPGYAFTVFLPTIITGLGYSSTNAQLLTVPPNATGAFFVLLACYWSDRKRARGPFILVGSVVGVVGYIVLLITHTPATRYAGTVVVAAGLFPSTACVLAWTGGNFGGEVKKAVVIALVVGCGNFGGIPGSFIYRQQDAPRYLPGHLVSLASLCTLFALANLAIFRFSRLNRRKIAQCEREGITAEKSDQFVDLGDDSPLYRYTI